MYECVDKDAESIPGNQAIINGGLLYHVHHNDSQKELTCMWRMHQVNNCTVKPVLKTTCVIRPPLLLRRQFSIILYTIIYRHS